MSLLRYILDFLFPPRDTESLVRDATAERVSACVEPRLLPDGTVALLSYRLPLVKALIVEAKFKDNEKAQELLSSVLVEYVREWHAEQSAFESMTCTLIPVPLSAARARERGYNQVERIVFRALGLMPEVAGMETTLLVRTRDTAPQTSLSGTARRQNIQGAFSTTGPCDPSSTYIVIDDVTTTGSTLHEAIETLRNAGATDVSALALAH